MARGLEEEPDNSWPAGPSQDLEHHQQDDAMEVDEDQATDEAQAKEQKEYPAYVELHRLNRLFLQKTDDDSESGEESALEENLGTSVIVQPDPGAKPSKPEPEKPKQLLFTSDNSDEDDGVKVEKQRRTSNLFNNALRLLSKSSTSRTEQAETSDSSSVQNNCNKDTVPDFGDDINGVGDGILRSPDQSEVSDSIRLVEAGPSQSGLSMPGIEEGLSFLDELNPSLEVLTDFRDAEENEGPPGGDNQETAGPNSPPEQLGSSLRKVVVRLERLPEGLLQDVAGCSLPSGSSKSRGCGRKNLKLVFCITVA